ncbi:MAG: chromosome segregation protein SMC [Clostridia bacterium]|nr:chromosome segregation protein SMC [Clostridia bacterium]
MAYLKSLELSGFKSFPDKVNIAFTDGICAIVGPNGSGKSNICDAIRWVFGEQSAKTLRGDRMEDVIFGGTQTRRPTGFAEVTLTLDNSSGIFNSDYSELSVTRRYFRSGESEYFINRAQVRLKDVHELFMDTGLGRDGYSIIGQGRIAEILSQKSFDRRQIFEEAAGISKYRYKKLESEKKLRSTQENLERLSDIIVLLSEREKTLEVQSKKAREYLSLRESLRKFEVTLFIRSYESAKQENIRLTERTADLKAELSEKRDIQNDVESRLESMTGRIRETDIEINTKRTFLQEQRLKLQKTQSDAAVMEDEVKRNLSDIDRLLLKSGAKQQTLLSNEALINETRTQIDTLISEHEALRERLDAIDKECEKKRADEQNKQTEIYALRRETDEIKTQIASLREKISSLASAVSIRRSQQSGRDQSVLSLKNKADELRAGLIKNTQEEKTLSKELSEKITLYENERALGKKLSNELSADRARMNDLERINAAAHARLNMLSELKRELEGFLGSVKFVIHSKQAGRLSGVEGTVADLFAVRERYAAAVETALGAAVQNIVVSDEEEAKAAIKLLKETKSGRATFLPLSAVRGQRYGFEALSHHKGFISCAFDAVKCDKKYEGIFLYLLGRTALFEDLDSAVSAAKATGYKTRIVTLDGQLINAGGSLTGGSLSKTAGIVTRASQMARLKDECAENEKTIKSLKQASDEKNAHIEEHKKREETLEAEVRAIQEALSQKKSEGEFLRRSIMDTQTAHNEAISERADASSLMKTDEEAKAELEKELDACLIKLASANEILFSKETRHKALLQAVRDAETELSEAKLSLEMKKKDMDVSKARLISYEQKGGEIGNESAALEDEAKGLAAKNEELKIRITESNAESRRITNELNEGENSLNAMIAEKIQLDKSYESLIREQRETAKHTGELERELVRLETKLETEKARIEEAAGKLWEAYELTPAAAGAYVLSEDEVSNAQAQSLASDLKRKIHALGSINADAIDEYDEVKEKLDFLKLQTEDLIKAKNSLENIVSGLTRRMREIFSEQFRIINKNFSATFSELFGGGRAWLELEDENDVLNCGIEIHVQPPGKNVKSISLLSGGEQAFTAIAVLFAMLKIRPAPFCVLDEVEAALDEVNVVRFGRYIESFKDKTQFVVITHRRGTMEFADMLYGVTMQEKGVSKLISINVRDAAKQMNIIR